MEPQTDGATKEEGLRLLKAGQVSDAIGVLGRVIASDPNDAQAHMLLGIACQQGGDSPRAAHHLQESIRLREDPRAYYNLGQVYESSKRADDAKIQYRRALLLDANYANAKQALDRLEAPSKPTPVTVPGLDQTQAVSPPPPMSQTQAIAPPAPWARNRHPTDLPAAHLLSSRTRSQEQLKIQEAHNELMRNGLIYGSICGAILFVLLGFLGAFLAFAAVSRRLRGSFRSSSARSSRSDLRRGGRALDGIHVRRRDAGRPRGGGSEGRIHVGAGADRRDGRFCLVLHWPVGAIGGAVSGYIIGKLVDASIGQV